MPVWRHRSQWWQNATISQQELVSDPSRLSGWPGQWVDVFRSGSFLSISHSLPPGYAMSHTKCSASISIFSWTVPLFLISNFCRVLNLLCILLGVSPASDCCMPTFRNPLSVPSSRAGCKVLYIQPLKMKLIEGSETSANHNRTPGKYPKEYIQDSKHGESLKSRILYFGSTF